MVWGIQIEGRKRKEGVFVLLATAFFEGRGWSVSDVISHDQSMPFNGLPHVVQEIKECDGEVKLNKFSTALCLRNRT
jgi:hypothetical protein